MGQNISGPPGLDEQQSKAARNAYAGRVSKALHGATFSEEHSTSYVLWFHVDERAAREQSVALQRKEGDISPHWVAVTHGNAWKYGNEFVVRLAHSDSAETLREQQSALNSILGLAHDMQSNCVFGQRQSAETMPPFPFEHPQNGSQGALLTADAILKGIAEVNAEEKRDHDEQYWPGIFVQFCILYPDEYNFITSLPVAMFESVCRDADYLLVCKASRRSLLETEPFASELNRLRLEAPASLSMVGLSMDVRIRKQGRAIDVCLAGRALGPVFLSLQQAFCKPVVPRGSLVSFTNEGGECCVTVAAHAEDGTPITPETAFYQIDDMQYARVLGQNKIVPAQLSAEKSVEYALLPPGALFTTHQLIRRLHLRLFLPAALLGMIVNDVRTNVESKSVGDIEEQPLFMEWPGMFKGTAPCGFSGHLTSEGERARLRFCWVGMSVFDDRAFINDDGQLEKRARGEGDSDEDDQDDDNADGAEGDDDEDFAPPIINCSQCKQQIPGNHYVCETCELLPFCAACEKGGHAHPLTRRAGFLCDGCAEPILAGRYSCEECGDFDYCVECYKTGADSHEHPKGFKFHDF